jgi:CRP/FNR family transcriptional regulator, nitrogen oxide reductase regulator
MDEDSAKARAPRRGERPRGAHDWPADDLPPEACTLDLRRRVLAMVPYFAGLNDDELSIVHAAFRAVPMAAGANVVAAGAPAESLFVLASGRVKLVSVTPTGGEHVVDVLGPGDAFGALPLLGAPDNDAAAVSLTSGCLLVTSAEAFAGLVTSLPGVALAVLEDVSGRLQDAHARLRRASGAPVDARLAAALLTLSARLGRSEADGRTLGAPLSQEDLAALAGSTLETVNRVLSRWRERGWVRTGRRRVVLRDIAALEAVSRGDEP